METYNGLVRTPTDAIILFEACRVGILPRVQRRLSEKERQSIKSGSVFVWDEREAGMRRWTDGKSWSASRVAGSFLTYREMEGKRGGNGFDKNANRDGLSNQEADSDGGPDGYRYKPDGLMKQSFSITTSTNQHLHLISYFTRSSTTASNMPQPSTDPHLRHIRPEKGMYPDSTVQEHNNIPAVTRGPMSSPGYTHAPNQQPPYGRGPSQPYYQQHPSWAPPSPMHTPPPHNSYQPYFSQPPYHHSGHHYSGPPPPHAGYGGPPHAYDRGPPSSGPPPPHHYSHGPPPPPTNGYAHTYPPHPPQSYNVSTSALDKTRKYPNSPPQSAYSPYQPPPIQNPYPASHAHGHESRPTAEQPRQPSSEAQEKPRSDSHQEQKRPSPKPAALDPPASTAQTIPSISAMLNGSEHGGPPARTSSRSPNGTLRAAPLQDIPSHKLGFEVNRDVQALRNLDKTTFKGY